MGILVLVRSYEKNLFIALSKIINEFSIKENDLKWKSEYLSIASWDLYRLDDNNNEFKMFCFHSEDNANQVKKRYEEKGHKQVYFVKQKIFK